MFDAVSNKACILTFTYCKNSLSSIFPFVSSMTCLEGPLLLFIIAVIISDGGIGQWPIFSNGPCHVHLDILHWEWMDSYSFQSDYCLEKAISKRSNNRSITRVVTIKKFLLYSEMIEVCDCCSSAVPISSLPLAYL